MRNVYLSVFMLLMTVSFLKGEEAGVQRLLSSGKWIFSSSGVESEDYFDFQFLPGGKIRGEQYPTLLEGTFSILDDGITLMYKINNPYVHPDSGKAPGPEIRTECRLVRPKGHFLLKHYYACDNGKKIYDVKNAVDDGSDAMVDGIQVKTIKMRRAVTTTHVRIRNNPGTDSAVLYYFKDDACENKQKSIPPGAEIVLIARTVAKDTVGKQNDYWYYVDDLSYRYRCRKEKFGWVYGAFIRVK